MQEKYQTLLNNLSRAIVQPSNEDERVKRAAVLVKYIIMGDAIKELSAQQLGEDFWDLNPHLTVDYVIQEVIKVVEAEGLTTDKYDVALYWLTNKLTEEKR